MVYSQACLIGVRVHDTCLVEKLGIPVSTKRPTVNVKSGTSESVVVRTGLSITMRLRGKTIHTVGSVSERQHLRFPVIIGRKSLKGFLVDPGFRVKDVRKEKVIKKNGAQ